MQLTKDDSLLLSMKQGNIDRIRQLSITGLTDHEARSLLLAASGAVPPHASTNEEPSSSLASRGICEGVVKLLLDLGVDMESNYPNRRTPLSYAAENGREAISQLFIDAGANPDVEDLNWRTPLSYAAENGHEGVVRLLLDTARLRLAKNGVDVNSKDKDDQTPLSWAARNDHKEVVKLLLAEDEIDVNLKDKDEQTPLLWAARNGFEEVLKLLLVKDSVDVDFNENYDRVPMMLPLSANILEAFANLHTSFDNFSGQLESISVPDRLYPSLDFPVSRWSPHGMISAGYAGFRSPSFDLASAHYRQHRSGSFLTREEESVASQQHPRGRHDHSTFSDPGFEETNMRDLVIDDHKLVAPEGYRQKAVLKRRTSSPKSESAREGRSTVVGNTDLYHRRSAQMLISRNSPMQRFQGCQESLSSASSSSHYTASFASSYGPSTASSVTSYGSNQRLLPNASPSSAEGELDLVSLHAANRLPGAYICECCPKKPKKFKSEVELR